MLRRTFPILALLLLAGCAASPQPGDVYKADAMTVEVVDVGPITTLIEEHRADAPQLIFATEGASGAGVMVMDVALPGEYLIVPRHTFTSKFELQDETDSR